MVGRGKDSVDEQKKVTKCHVFRCDNQIITAIDQKSMEGRTTTVVRNAPEHTKKDSIDGVFIKWWAGVDSNHRSLATADLQSAPFSHSGTYPYLVFNKFAFDGI